MAPELKHITVGGATVGIGIESTCFRYGFVPKGQRLSITEMEFERPFAT